MSAEGDERLFLSTFSLLFQMWEERSKKRNGWGGQSCVHTLEQHPLVQLCPCASCPFQANNLLSCACVSSSQPFISKDISQKVRNGTLASLNFGFVLSISYFKAKASVRTERTSTYMS